MSTPPRLLAFAGSARADSWNKKLVRIAARGARAVGATVSELDLADFPLPLYDGDLESADGLPASVLRLQAHLRQSDGFLISCPEYNGSITPLLKNTMDWCSRPGPDPDPSGECYRDKVVGLMSASPGGLGGMRGLVHVRAILGHMGCLVLPNTLSVSSAFSAFDVDGELIDEKQRAHIEAIGAAVARTATRLGS